MKKLLGILILAGSTQYGWSQTTAEESNRAGNDFYKNQQYDLAESSYRAALELDGENTIARFNLANTLVRLNKQSEANKLFTDIGDSKAEKEVKAGAHYNKGVVLSNQKRLEESIEAYKNALRENPDDTEARENLQKALLELKKKTPPRQQDQKQNQKKQDQKKQQQPKMSQKEAEQRLDLLEQKEKEVQERLQKEKSKSGGGQGKDW